MISGYGCCICNYRLVVGSDILEPRVAVYFRLCKLQVCEESRQETETSQQAGEDSKEPIVDTAPAHVGGDESEEEQSIQVRTKHPGDETSQEINPPPSPSHSGLAASTARSTQSPIIPRKDMLLIKQGITSLNRDEHRFSATFKYSKDMWYFVLVDDVSAVLHELVQGKGEAGFPRKRLGDVVLLILNRRSLPPAPPPPWPRRRRLCFFGELSSQYSTRQFLALSSSAERPLQPRSS